MSTGSRANPPPGLRRFFDELTGYLFEDRPLADVKAALGEAPSRDERFAVYRGMVRGNPRRVIRATLKATRTLAERHREGLFEELLERHLRARPPRGWHLPAVPLGFSEGLAAAVEDGVSLPAGLDEVADYEEVRQQLLTLDLGPPVPGELHPSAFVRSYTFDVPGFVTRTRKGELVEPAGDATTRVFHRHPLTRRVASFAPALPHLLVVAVVEGELDEAAAADHGVAAEELATARRQLEERGIVVPETALSKEEEKA